MPRWQMPAHLAEPSSDTPRGRLVTHEIDSQVLDGRLPSKCICLAGYDDSGNERRYPVVYYHELEGPLEMGSIVTSPGQLARPSGGAGDCGVRRGGEEELAPPLCGYVGR